LRAIPIPGIVMRDARRLTLHVKLAERPLHSSQDNDGLANEPRPRVPEPSPDSPLGLTVREMDREFTKRVELPEGVQGVRVSRADPAGAAFSAGVHNGFVIL